MMTRHEFKMLWESNDDGGGITFDDIACCAIEWGISSKPRTCHLQTIQYLVLVAANVDDAELYKPQNDD